MRIRIGIRTIGISSVFMHDDAIRLAHRLLDADETVVTWGDLDRANPDDSSIHARHGLLDVSVPVANFAEVWPRFLAGCHDH